MSIRAIEPGCLVVILEADFPGMVGKCATVIGRWRGEFVNHKGNTVNGDGWWVLDVPGEDGLGCRPASSLLRIDGGEDESVSTEQEREVVA